MCVSPFCVDSPQAECCTAVYLGRMFGSAETRRMNDAIVSICVHLAFTSPEPYDGSGTTRRIEICAIWSGEAGMVGALEAK